MQYMKATLIAKAKEVHDDGSIVEVVIWELPEPTPPKTLKPGVNHESNY